MTAKDRLGLKSIDFLFTYSASLLFQTGDGLIDHEEFEYVLSEFGVSERTARQAFTIVTEVGIYFSF